MDRVVQDAEEEHEIERLQLEKPLGAAEVAVYEPVRLRERVDPLGVEVYVRFEVGEDELGWAQLAVDPARVDAVLRPDLEHARPAKALDIDDATQ